MTTITVLIPAHNEADCISNTLYSIIDQSHPVSRILVVSDNSTDNTVKVAKSMGVDVIETRGNTHRKAGALNQALDSLDRSGLILVMDADTVLSADWVKTALEELEDPRVGGVGAVFQAANPHSYLELCQKLEWSRFAEHIDRTGKTFVMSGTAALIRWEALESVRRRFGHWYDQSTITEDSRLSMDLKMCGWMLRSPVACSTITETMPTVKMLWLQRRRWYLGAMQNVVDLGINKITLPYWGQQIMLAISVILMSSYLALMGFVFATGNFGAPSLAWLAVGVVFAVERCVTVWSERKRHILFAGLVIPELVYALILQSAYIGALIQKLTGSSGTWAHIDRKD